MLEGFELVPWPLPSVSRYVFSLLMILCVAIVTVTGESLLV